MHQRTFAPAKPPASYGLSPRLEVSVSIAKCFVRRVLVGSAVATAAVGLPTAADAQVVRGTVVDEASGRALPATVVVLLDSTGKRLAGVLTGEDGRYAIRITIPGRYAIRAERIGFRAEAPTPVTLGVGQTVELRLATRPVPVVLGTVRVTGRTTCVARASDGREVSEVWDEARKALYATDLTQQQELFEARISRFQRTLDPQTGRVTGLEATQRDGVTRNPFVSVPAAQLSEHGFVRHNSSETIYYGPDAAVLLSDEFLGDHCFRLRAGSGRRTDLIGLEFEPARGREKPEIAGTLWLDRKTAELRDLEYTYRNLPNLPSDLRPDEFGGRIEFQRMPTGAWIVQRWVIRMPMLVDKGPFARRDAVVPGTASRTERIELAGIREEGGEVLSTVARGTRRDLARDVASVKGTVFDSTRMVPLENARVFLDGTQFSARTSADGGFVIDQIPPGTYTLGVAHARFDSLDVRAPSATVTLQASEATPATLAGPSIASMFARDCTSDERAAGPVMLRGTVRDESTGRPAADAEVRLTWNGIRSTVTRITQVTERQAGTRTNPAGRFVICGVPEGVRVTARAVFDGRRSAPVSLVSGDGLSFLDLAVGSEEVFAAVEPAKPAPAIAAPTVPLNRVMQEFDRRRRRGNGAFLTRAQIDKSNASRLTDLLRRMPSVTILPSENGQLQVELRGSKKISFSSTTTRTDSGSSTTQLPGPPQGTSQVSIKNCPAGFMVDGMAIDAGSSVDLEMRPGMIEAIEVYSPAQVPIEYSGRYSECGVVMIWTRSFAERPDN